ncbi:hypothetical protein D917_07941 [Trichinella nativa]|uniref:Uncharacterized protein n=1 Tax=Trichinella nativa TaxID=6335 RepID=A0A1Y3ESW4_9BILA|nr:hypothetical protein D917_07941 [Trichinella nativa]
MKILKMQSRKLFFVNNRNNNIIQSSGQTIFCTDNSKFKNQQFFGVLLLSMDMLVMGQIHSWPAKEDTLREEARIYLKSLLLKFLLMKQWKTQADVNFINQKYLMVKRIAKPSTRTRSLCPPIVCNVDWRPT